MSGRKRVNLLVLVMLLLLPAGCKDETKPSPQSDNGSNGTIGAARDLGFSRQAFDTCLRREMAAQNVQDIQVKATKACAPLRHRYYKAAYARAAQDSHPKTQRAHLAHAAAAEIEHTVFEAYKTNQNRD